MKLKFKSSIAYFGMPMGLLGLSLNVKHAEAFLAWQSFISTILIGLGWLSLLIISLAYVKDFIFSNHRETLISEWQDAFKITLFPIVTLTFLLFIGALNALDINQAWVIYAFILVAGIHTILSFKLFNRWIYDCHLDIKHLKPTWFIVLSGNFYLIILASQLFKSSVGVHEFLWFYFSYSLFMWLVLATVLFYRLFFEEPLSSLLRPSLFIFIAPPSLATMASLQLFDVSYGKIPFIVWGFYSFATLMLLLWGVAFSFFKNAPLSMGGWSYVYPLAAYGLMNQYMGNIDAFPLFWWIAFIVFSMTLGFVILLLTWQIKTALINPS